MIFINVLKNGKGKVTQMGVTVSLLKSLNQLPKMSKNMTEPLSLISAGI